MAATMFTSDTKTRDRKVNFTDEELSRLLACYKEHASVLVSKFDNLITQKVKNGLWAKVASQVSATGIAARSSLEVKTKWANMKRASLKPDTRKRMGDRLSTSRDLWAASWTLLWTT